MGLGPICFTCTQNDGVLSMPKRFTYYYFTLFFIFNAYSPIGNAKVINRCSAEFI